MKPELFIRRPLHVTNGLIIGPWRRGSCPGNQA